MKEIPEFKGYWAREDGTIWSYKGKTPIQLKLRKHWFGYPSVTLSKDSKNYNFTVKRLIAITYLDIPKGTVVSQKNGNLEDTRLSNIILITQSDKINKGLASRSKAVELTNIATSQVFLYESLAEAARSLKLSQSSITKVCNGVLKHTKGYKAKYVNVT
jgi:hypothetical protein